MSNVEGMYSVYFKKRLSKAKPPFDILRFDIRYFAVRCSGHLKFHTSVRTDGDFSVRISASTFLFPDTRHLTPET